MALTGNYSFSTRPFAAALLLVPVLFSAACSPVTATRGNYLEVYQLDEVKPGEHTKSDVIKILGSPTTVAPFNDNVWIYLGQHTEKHGIFDPEVVDEMVITVTFAEDGKVLSVHEREDERINIPISENQTPTHGNDITIMQQFLGNIGKFNPQDGVSR